MRHALLLLTFALPASPASPRSYVQGSSSLPDFCKNHQNIPLAAAKLSATDTPTLNACCSLLRKTNPDSDMDRLALTGQCFSGLARRSPANSPRTTKLRQDYHEASFYFFQQARGKTAQRFTRNLLGEISKTQRSFIRLLQGAEADRLNLEKELDEQKTKYKATLARKHQRLERCQKDLRGSEVANTGLIQASTDCANSTQERVSSAKAERDVARTTAAKLRVELNKVRQERVVLKQEVKRLQCKLRPDNCRNSR